MSERALSAAARAAGGGLDEAHAVHDEGVGRACLELELEL